MTVFGIMTHDAGRPERYTLYAREALRLGFRETLLFAPRDVAVNAGRVAAWSYDGSGWRRRLSRLPGIAHDMGFYTDAGTIRRVKRIKAVRSPLPFTSYALGHKWRIHEQLLRTEYAPYLPETELLRSGEDPLRLVRRYGAVMVKPRDGKQGKGIVRISRAGAGAYRWKEQQVPTAVLSRQALADRLAARFRPATAVVQRWMDIRCPKGGVFDIRALAQKTEAGLWRTTATAIRQGGVGRIASNVTGGGTVREPAAFLAELYGEAEAERLLQETARLAAGLPAALERAYGKRFAELGIDLAIERCGADGRRGAVRIIEVNIKPGKKIVRALSGERAYADARLAPIRYARWLTASSRHLVSSP